MRLRNAAPLVLAIALASPVTARATGDADVAALQVGLEARDLYGADVDGYVGPHTLAGLRRLQGATTLFGPATRAALGEYGAHALGSRPLVKGTFGWDGPGPELSPQQAAASLPSSKVITISPPSR